MDWRLLRFAGIDLPGQFGGSFLGFCKLVRGESGFRFLQQPVRVVVAVIRRGIIIRREDRIPGIGFDVVLGNAFADLPP